MIDNTATVPSAAPVPPPGAPVRSDFRRTVEMLQTILTALILAFIFRAFWVEAFIIPTGSMAPGLLGLHATLLCPVCGWEFDFAGQVGTSDSPFAERFDVPEYVLCPNCHVRLAPDAAATAAKAGDRILVHKWPYFLPGTFGLRRWEVIVFRDPANPTQNYIKRLIGLPGETVEIVAGDVFINGRIARKPPAAQRQLWTIVFDQRHFPGEHPLASQERRWRPTSGSGDWNGLTERVIRFQHTDDQPAVLEFNADASPLYWQDVSGYNGGSSGTPLRDVRIVTDLRIDGGTGSIEWQVQLDAQTLSVELRTDGSVFLYSARPGQPSEVLDAQHLTNLVGQGRQVEVGHLDYRFYLKIDDREVLATKDEQYAPDLTALRAESSFPPARIRIVSTGVDFALRGLRVERDVHYTFRPGATVRAFADAPFDLRDGEYFVLGDNSARSHDSREWYQRGPHLRDGYRVGTVRADQIVGRAFLVYLPGLLPLDAAGQWRMPDLGRVRFVR